MKRIKGTSEVVLKVLQEIPATRNSDDLLYLKVCERFNPLVLGIGFEEVLRNRNRYGVPPFESVRRSRQRLRNQYPKLCGTDDVEAQRTLNEEIVKAYAISNT